LGIAGRAEDSRVVQLDKLDDFSRLIYELLSEAYPEWKDRISNVKGNPEAIALSVSAKSGGDHELELNTLKNEITVSFGNFHDHFGWSDVPDEEAFEEAKELIDKILSDEILIAEYSKNGTVFQAETAYPFELENYRKSKYEVRVFGWSKKYI
jgi:hypothetical protein